MSLILYKKHFEVYIKGIEQPIEVSQEGGETLQKILEGKDCPSFVRINGGSYNRFEIARVVPYEEHISKERAEALAEHARIQAIINNKK